VSQTIRPNGHFDHLHPFDVVTPIRLAIENSSPNALLYLLVLFYNTESSVMRGFMFGVMYSAKPQAIVIDKRHDA